MYCNYISSMNLNTNLISNHIFLTLSWSCWSAQEFCSVGDDSCLILWDARVGSSPVVKVCAYTPVLYLNLFLFIIGFIEVQILRQFFFFVCVCEYRTFFLLDFTLLPKLLDWEYVMNFRFYQLRKHASLFKYIYIYNLCIHCIFVCLLIVFSLSWLW